MLTQYLEQTPSEAKAIIEKCLTLAKAREAARAAKDLIQRKNTLDTTLPGKLADCSERGIQTVVNSIWWKAIPQAEVRNKGVTVIFKLFSHYVVRSSTSNA